VRPLAPASLPVGTSRPSGLALAVLGAASVYIHHRRVDQRLHPPPQDHLCAELGRRLVQVSKSCSRLVQKMLTVDPGQRITAADLLQHPWVQTNMPPELAAVNDNLLVSSHKSWSCSGQVAANACNNMCRCCASEFCSGPAVLPQHARVLDKAKQLLLQNAKAAEKPWPPLAAAALALNASGGDATLEQLVPPHSTRRFSTSGESASAYTTKSAFC
jgi:serine/threonine protein kinase